MSPLSLSLSLSLLLIFMHWEKSKIYWTDKNRKIMGLRLFSGKCFTCKTKYWKYFSAVFFKTQSNKWKCFPFCKIFSTENISQLEIILHVSKHTLKHHFLLSKIFNDYLNRNAILVFFYHLIFKSQDRTKFISSELVKIYFTNKIFFFLIKKQLIFYPTVYIVSYYL